ncbi:unnamed protein product [Tilletia controversa]|nr:unnamed protein product [Tilletia controversa]CAD6980557.1 unnamed protein product [Tilletia controversa]
MAHPFEPTMTPSQMYQVNRPALERSTSASGSWADRRQPPTAAKYRNLLPDENEDVPELEHELDDAEPDFELEEESFTGPSINATPSPRYPSTFGEQQGVPSPSS